MSKEIDPVYFTNHVNRKLRTSDDLQGEASVHGLSLASTVQIGTVDAADKIFTLDSTGNFKTSNNLVFKGESGSGDNLVSIQGGLNVEDGSGLFVRSASGIRVVGVEDTDTIIKLERYTNSWKAAVHFTPSGTLNAGNAEFQLGFYYGSQDFSLRINTGTDFEALKVSTAGLVSIKSGVTVSGNTAISGTLTQRGAASFLNDVTVSTNTTVTGNLGVSGAASLNSLDVSGAFTASGLVVKNNVTVSGNIGISGTATIEDLVVNGSSTLDGDFGVVGDTTLNTLDVTGAFARVSGVTTLNTLNVTGATVGISGASTINTLNVTGASTLMSGTLGVSGATTLNTLTSTGATVGLSGALTQRGAASFLNNVTISGNTLVSGNVATSGSITGTSLIKDGYGPFFNILDGYVNGNPSAFKLIARPEAPSIGGSVPSRYTVSSIEKISSTVNGAIDTEVNGIYVGVAPNSGTTSRSELLVAVSAQGVSSSTATTPFNGSNSFSGISFLALSPDISSRLAGTTGPITTYGIYIEPQKTGTVITSGVGIYQAGSDDSNYLLGTSFISSIDSGLRVTGSSNFFTKLTFLSSTGVSLTTSWDNPNSIVSFPSTILSVSNTPSTESVQTLVTETTGISIKLAVETGAVSYNNKAVGIYVNALNSSTSSSKFTFNSASDFTGIALLAGSPQATEKDPAHTGEIQSYGLYVESQKSSSLIDQGFGIYQAGSSDSNYFAGATTFAANVDASGYNIVATNGSFQTVSGQFLQISANSWVAPDSNDFLLIGAPFYTLPETGFKFVVDKVSLFKNDVTFSGDVFIGKDNSSLVGINTLTPASGLDVNTDAVFRSGVTISGTVKAYGNYSWENSDSYFLLNSKAENDVFYTFLNRTPFNQSAWAIHDDAVNATALSVFTSSTPPNTRVGINTLTPSSGLDVNTNAVFRSGVTVSGNLNVSGVTTAASLIVTGNATITGNLNVSGDYYWQPGANFKAISTAYNQEWSVDLDRSSFVRSTWQIFDIQAGDTILKVQSYLENNTINPRTAKSVEINGRVSFSSFQVYTELTNDYGNTSIESEYYFHYVSTTADYCTVTLPLLSEVPHGTEYLIYNQSDSKSLAISRKNSDMLIFNGSDSNLAQSLGAKRSCKVISSQLGWLYFDQPHI